MVFAYVVAGILFCWGAVNLLRAYRKTGLQPIVRWALIWSGLGSWAYACTFFAYTRGWNVLMGLCLLAGITCSFCRIASIYRLSKHNTTM